MNSNSKTIISDAVLRLQGIASDTTNQTVREQSRLFNDVMEKMFRDVFEDEYDIIFCGDFCKCRVFLHNRETDRCVSLNIKDFRNNMEWLSNVLIYVCKDSTKPDSGMPCRIALPHIITAVETLPLR